MKFNLFGQKYSFNKRISIFVKTSCFYRNTIRTERPNYSKLPTPTQKLAWQMIDFIMRQRNSTAISHLLTIVWSIGNVSNLFVRLFINSASTPFNNSLRLSTLVLRKTIPLKSRRRSRSFSSQGTTLDLRQRLIFVSNLTIPFRSIKSRFLVNS